MISILEKNMKKLLRYILLLMFSSGLVNVSNAEKTAFPENEKSNTGGCLLTAEVVSGKVEISYEYDSLNRLAVKNYLTQNYKDIYSYDKDGFLVKITNLSDNPYTIDFVYKDNLLVLKTITHLFISNPQYFKYEYNEAGELIKITETLLTSTVTEFSNGKAIKITNPFIVYELNELGLVIKSKSIGGTQTENLYKYDKNHMLTTHEIYSEPGKKIMYTEYKNTKIKKANLGDEFINNYKGFPKFVDPFGDKSYYVSGLAYYSANMASGLFEKTYSTESSLTVDTSGKLVNSLNINNIASPIREYIYSNCN